MVEDEQSPVKEGDVLAGKYRVERVLGVGGVGIVVAATHVELDQKVALKFLRKSALQNEDAVERFLREARAVVRMKSEHAVKVLDVGKLEDGAPYMVMELLEGCDFATLMQERGQLPIVEAVDFILQACEALAEAHAAGIVHRDLKPENLFLTTGADHRPLVKVLDFGLLKTTAPAVSGRSQRALTGTMVMGTPAYMSPEQWTSTSAVDARSDIWALGVVIYELLSNKLPFDAEAMSELIAMVARDAPKPITEHRPDVPPALAAVISQCLEKDPEKRFSKVSKLAAALSAFVGDDGPQSIARIGRMQRSVMPPPTPALAWQPTSVVGVPRESLSTQGEIATRKGAGKAFFLGLIAIFAVAAGGVLAVKYRAGKESDAVARAIPESVASVATVLPVVPRAEVPSAVAAASTPPTALASSPDAGVVKPRVGSGGSPPQPHVKTPPKKDVGAQQDDRRLLETR